MQMQETIPGINYEVALELLGDSMRPLIQARESEFVKDKPNQAFIEYCTARLEAIDMLRDSLSPEDTDIIARIFNLDDQTVGRVK
ncbi:TPA: hypothetical protein ACFI9R_002297 [Neisseria gonorrhoeae]